MNSFKRIPFYCYLLAMAGTIIIVGVEWDIPWHESSEDFVCDFGLIEENGQYKNLDGKGRITFPSINLKSGKYRLFMQVKIKETQEIISKKFNFIVI